MTPPKASAPQANALQDILAEMMGHSPECERFAERIGTALAFGAKRDPASAQVREVEGEVDAILPALLDSYEAALPVVCECGSTAALTILDAHHNVLDSRCGDCGKPKQPSYRWLGRRDG